MERDDTLRILLIDDDEDLLDLLKYNFNKEGFRVKTMRRQRSALATARKFQPHLIVLDISMPDGNGIELCKQIRSLSCFKDTVVFFLSACSEPACRDSTLAIGADDFIGKVSGLRVLTNKVVAVLKDRFVIKKSVSRLSLNDLVISKHNEAVSYRNREMRLSKPEFEILFFLMQNPDKVISGKILVNIIWGSEIFMLAPSVENCIQNLQKKIGPGLIETLGSGRYRLNTGVS